MSGVRFREVAQNTDCYSCAIIADMDSLDRVLRNNEDPKFAHKVIGDEKNWPTDTVEDETPAVSAGGRLNTTEDAMIAKIDKENAEKRKKGKEGGER